MTGTKGRLDMQTDAPLPAWTRFLYELQSSPSILIVSRIPINANGNGSNLKTAMTVFSIN